MKLSYSHLGAAVALLLTAACTPLGQHPDPTPAASVSADATRDPNLAMGNPSGAIASTPEGSSDASRVTTSTRVRAVNMPNTTAISTKWGSYRTTVDAIKAATGYNLLSAVSSTVQSAIESRTDSGPTN